MGLTLTLPALDAHPANPPETNPVKIGEWLVVLLRREPVEAARTIGDALATLNRVAIADSRRLELAERFWNAAEALWPVIERRFADMQHPLTGAALEAAKAALALSHELSVAYKLLLAREAGRRHLLGSSKTLSSLVQHCLRSMARTINNSYLAYAPIPSKTWLDAHRVYAFARDRGLHQQPVTPGVPDITIERIYVEVLLLALANPYGLAPGQLETVVRYVHEHAKWAKLTDVQPVHRSARAVAIIPVGHDFPPFAANKGGAVEGRKLYLLTFDLAFQIQEQLRALEAGGDVPAGTAGDRASRRSYVGLLNRLLRQWAIPPARQFNRVPSRAPVVTCAGLSDVWQYARDAITRSPSQSSFLTTLTKCEVVNHTPTGYAMRQTDTKSAALRIGDIVGVALAGRGLPQIAWVRWLRNTLKGSSLEFGCELLSDLPRAELAIPEGAREEETVKVLVLPSPKPDDPDGPPAQVLVPVHTFKVEQGIRLEHHGETRFAVLTKLVEQGPGVERYEFVAVG